MSSTNPSPICASSSLFISSNRLQLKRRKRIGERGEPWGIPVCVWISGPFWPSNSSRVLRWLKNPEMTSRSQSGSPFLINCSSRRSWETLSKAALKSSERTETISSGSVRQMVWVASVSSEIAVAVDLFLLAPNCVFGRSWFSSRTVESLSAIRRSRTFPRVFSSAIGL